MATLNLDDYDFSGLADKEETTTLNTPAIVKSPALNLTPQEPFVVSEAQTPESEDTNLDFSGLLEVKKPGRKNAVSSGYGSRTAPVKGASSFHDGIDIPLDINTPLKPFGNGEVFFAGTRKGYGKSVGIDYGNGIKVYLNHLNETDVEVGDKVTADAIIGLSGNTGVSTGPHVHIQTQKDGVSVDPRKIFNEDPSKVGLALTIRSLFDNTNAFKEANSSNLDFSGLARQEEQTITPKEVETTDLDFSGIASTTENDQVDTDILKFTPADKPSKVGYGQLFKEGFASHLGQMAEGIESVNKFKFKPRTTNPNAPGKAISFTISPKDIVDFYVKSGINNQELSDRYGKAVMGGPDLALINLKLAQIVGLSGLNEKYRKETGKPLVHLDNPILDKGKDGVWKVTVPYGMTSGAVELINAYSRGGLKAFKAKMDELNERIKIYQEDEQKQKQQFDSLQAFRKAHPYLDLLSNPSNPIKHGLEDAALSEIQLMHTFNMLPKALGISVTEGMDSEAYTKLIKEDMNVQKKINEAVASIPKEETVLGSIPRALTSAVAALPRYQVMGKLGSWTLPTITYLEALHQGNSNALKVALPMAVMVGSMHGMESAIANGINPLDLLRKSEIANKDLITSIAADAPGNSHYLLQTLNDESKLKFVNLAFDISKLKSELGGFDSSGAGIEDLASSFQAAIPKAIDFKAITPFQRQLVLRGTNALVNIGASTIVNPNRDFLAYADSLFIGLTLPVGKGGRGTTREAITPFTEHGIISGDTYTLPDGSVLLRAPVDEASGIMVRRITTREAPYIPSIIEERANEGIPASKQLNIPTVKTSTGVVLPIDQAALNLLALRRAYETGTYLTNTPVQTAGKVGKLNVIIDQRKQDILQAIKILDEAIPKETQDYFAKNEQSILEAIATNYEDRISKEEFVLGKKIIRKPKSQLSTEDVRPYNPVPTKESPTKNFGQWARRTMVSIEESGKKGLEANKANKGTFNAGIDPSDVPYLVQIGIGKLGRKALDAGEFLAEMVAEQGEEVRPFINEIYNQSKDFIDGVNNLAKTVSTKYLTNEGLITTTQKRPPFRIADKATIKNIFYIGSKYLKEAKEEDIPLDKVVATQSGVRTITLLKFGEDPNIAELTGRTDIVGNPEMPKAVKIGEDYYLFDGHHRSTTAKVSGETAIDGMVIDFNDVTNYQTRSERAEEKFGDIGKDNKWFTQEKQVEVRENFLSPPDSSQFNEGFTAAPQWIAKNASYLTQIVGFHVEDAYRRGIEPRLEEIIGRLRSEFGDWIDGVSMDKWREFLNNSIKFYQSNNADPFFSQFKQNILEKFPEGNLNAQSARALIDKLGTAQEIEWTSGLREWIDGKVKNREKIKKQELIDFVNQNQVKVDEVVLGQDLNEQQQARLQELKVRELDDTITAEESIEYQKLINRTNNTTRYDLKTYTSERLELEGSEKPKEVLLIVPYKSGVPTLGFAAFLDTKFGYDVEQFKNLSRFDQKNLEKAYRASGNSEDLYIQDSNPEIYQTDHWQQGNVVAHFRANERETIDGNKVFHSEEFQSDWNQRGRKEGYKTKNEDILDLYRIEDNDGYLIAYDKRTGEELTDNLRSDRDLSLEEFKKAIIKVHGDKEKFDRGYDNTVPRNPFMENSWKELAFKRFLRMGIENGADGVTWTTARQQRERYGRVVSGKEVVWQKNIDGTYTIGLSTPESEDVQYMDATQSISIEEVARLTNQDVANRIKSEEGVKDVGSKFKYGIISLDKTIDLNKGYSDYDTYFVNLAKKIGKKFGNAKYELKEIETSEAKEKPAAMLVPFSNSRTGENGFAWETLNEKRLSPDFKTREEAITNKPDGDYFYINDAHKSIEELNQRKIEKVHFLEITPEMRESILKEGLPTYGLPTQEPLKASAPIGIRNN
jgi:hypothetical protein